MRRDNEGWKAMFDHQHKHDDRRYGAAHRSATALWWSILRAARQALRRPTRSSYRGRGARDFGPRVLRLANVCPDI